MGNKKTDYSIKTKILASLIAIPLIMLTLLLFWSLDLFQKDKMAYIFDTTATLSNSMASQVATKLKSAEQEVKNLLEGLSVNFEWSGIAQKALLNNDTIYAISVFQFNKKVAYLERYKQLEQIEIQEHKKLTTWLNELDTNELLIDFDELSDLLYLGFTKNNLKVIIILNSKQIISSIRKPGPFIIGLLNKSNRLIISTEGINQSKEEVKKEKNNPISTVLPLYYQDSNITKSIKNENGDEYFIAYSPLPNLPLTLATAIKKSEALSVLTNIFNKSLLIFLILISSSIIIGVLLTEEITSYLADILRATQNITNGFFNIKIKIRRDDEVGDIAKSINIMAIEIKRLLKETETKVRMEQELKVAQLLQSTFFPQNIADYTSCQITGKFKPASECSGDWWYHFQLNGKIYCLIGDATGHGVSAALLTGTVFTTLKILLSRNVSDIKDIILFLNESIYQIYQGKIMMTFLIASFDPTTHTLRYINASHDPAIVLRKSSEKLNKKNLDHLMENRGPRLGEMENPKYEIAEMILNKGDRIFFYTDGIFDIRNRELKALNERVFYQFLTDSHFINQDINKFSDDFHDKLLNYQYKESNDDITFFTIEAG